MTFSMAACRAADDQDGVIAGDRAHDFGPLFGIERDADRLRAAGERVQHDELAHAVDGGVQRREQCLERRARVASSSVVMA